MKMVACEDDRNKVFSYQEVYGLHIKKLVYSKHTFFGAPNLQYTRLTILQKNKINFFETNGYKMINGFEIFGKVFSDPNDNRSGVYHPKTNVIILAKPDTKGAIAVLPNGEAIAVSSKSWKPSKEHFKEA